MALGPDPGETVVRFLGEWALRFLVITLTVSPAQRLIKRVQLIRLRRMLGLFTFAYAIVHFSAYFVFLAGLSLSEVVADFIERPYITLGMLALVLLIPLAVTSTRGWQRKLRRNWKKLHRLVYVTAVSAWIHLFWLTRDGFFEVAIYGSLIALLFLERIIRSRLPKRQPSINASS